MTIGPFVMYVAVTVAILKTIILGQQSTLLMFSLVFAEFVIARW